LAQSTCGGIPAGAATGGSCGVTGKFFALLIGVFAALGLLLAALGIYGVVSYSVTRQTQEIGIRMALGATAGRVQFSVMTKTLRLVVAGVAFGTFTSMLATKFIASLLVWNRADGSRTFAGTVLC